MRISLPFSAKEGQGPRPGLGIRAMSALVSLLLLVTGFVLNATPAHAVSSTGTSTEDTVSADPLPTVQIDGVAWTQLINGNTVYVGGSFANARPAGAAPGTNLTARSNLLAYNLTDGTLNTAWAPSANGQVRAFALSPDGSRLYVVGEFTAINGTTRSRVAALNPTTGAVVGSWAPAANGSVTSVVATDTTVYLAGLFTSINGTTRTKVAAVSASTGAVLPFNADVQGGYGARAIVLSPDKSKIVMGGSFTSVNGSTNPGRGLAALDATTGESLPWLINSVIRNGDEAAAILSLSSDGDSVYGTAFDYGGTAQDGFEGTFRASWSDGEMKWIEDCHGDTYDATPMGDVVYTASHAHYCGNIGGFPQTNPWGYQHSLAFTKSATGPIITPDPLGYRSFTGNQAPEMLHWYPKWVPGTYTGMSQAVFSVKTSNKYVVYGGEFPRVMGVAQQGLVRFAVKSIAPNKIGPEVQGTNWPLSLVSYKAGEIRLSWQANYDPDDEELTYYVYRQDKGTSVPIYTKTADSNFWTRPLMSFIDKTVTPGNTYGYKVRVYDPHGNLTSTGDWITVTATADGAATNYNDVILDSQPTYYWPMGETSGSLAYDWATGNNLNLAGATRAVVGPDQTEASLATGFSGTSGSRGATQAAVPGSTEFSIEAWFSTTSRSGGKIVGFGSAASGDSSSYDRHIYMSNSGQVTFGVYPGSTATLTSAAGFNDGNWHHVVATMNGAGLKLYLDDKLVGSRSDVTTAQSYSGYWRVGGDNQNGWPSIGSSKYFAGSISDVAIYGRALTRDDVDSHWTSTGRTSAIPSAPADLYGKAVYASDPQIYWRLGEPSGSTAADSGRDGNAGTYRGTVLRGQPGALAQVSNTAIGVSGGGYISSNASFNQPSLYSIEAWFKTSSTTGGKIVGFGNAQTGNSSSYDRHVYMSADGLIHFGTYTDTTNIISSTSALNDGKWHQVVAQQSSDGMQLYVDGELVDQNTVGSAQPYSGYWRVGGDSTWSGANYFTGSIDEVAIYGALLSRDLVETHYQLGRTGSPNQAPVASFTSSVSELTVAFDGSASSDPDGRVSKYSWDFGDGTPVVVGTNATPSHTYQSSGTYNVTLTVTDNLGATEDLTLPVTVTAPNAAPTASFTMTPTGLAVAFDGSASADSDGTIASYAWNFGDGTPVVSGTNAKPSHTYEQAGSYEVTLTVTDDKGATGTQTKNVEVTAPAPGNYLAQDAFSRTESSSWGRADKGGAWTVSGGASAFSVSNGKGLMSVPSGGTRSALLNAISSTDSISQVQVSMNQVYAGAGFGLTVVGRQVGSSNYAARVRVVDSSNTVRLLLLKDETSLVNSYTLPTKYEANQSLNVKLSVTGTSPTTVKAKIWLAGDPEPAAWTLSKEDSTAGMQTAGAVGLVSTVSSGSTNASTDFSYDDYSVTTTAPVANQNPTAAFTAKVTDLSVAFDASASSDPDGSITSYGWDFGDGESGTGKTVTHVYGNANSYNVKLTVTDNDGATDTKTITVNPSAHVDSNVVAEDAFSRVVTSGWGTAGLGGAWTISGTASQFSVDGDKGAIQVPPGGTRKASLNGVSQTDATVEVKVSSTQSVASAPMYVTLNGRQVGNSAYSARFRVESSGAVKLMLLRDETALASSVILPNVTYSAGDVYRLKIRVSGTNSTEVSAKLWKDGTTEPDWMISGTDATPALQVAGSVGLAANVGSASTNPLTTFATDDFKVMTP